MSTLVTGATGFVGRALVAALRARGDQVVATSRRSRTSEDPGIEWRICDCSQPETLPAVMEGVHVAYYLVHSMGDAHSDFVAHEAAAAHAFAQAAAQAGVQRIIYLGGPAPRQAPSEHLRSRLQVGEILRAGSVPTVELRASMVIGHGSASWQIVRDLAVRLPAMILPRWLRSRTQPVALDDVITALLAAAEMPHTESEWFDIPGPELMSGRAILERVAAVRGRRILAVEVPVLTPELSALWLKLVTRTDFALARELVVGLREDLIPKDGRFWERIGHTSLVPFDDAVRRAFEVEREDQALANTVDRRRWWLFWMAVLVWLVGFVFVRRVGPWSVFAIAGPALCLVALGSDRSLMSLLRPCKRTVGIGLAAGLLMVAATHAAFAATVTLLPSIHAATGELYALLDKGGLATGWRVALIVLIATSEEILFRGGVLSPQGAPGASATLSGSTISSGALSHRDRRRFLTVVLGYALTPLTLGSPLLVVCALGCGLVWAAMRSYSRSLVPPILTHLIWDVGVMVAFPLV